MAAFTYDAINAQGMRMTRRDPRGRRRRRRGSSFARAACLPQSLSERPASGDGGKAKFKKVKPKSLQIFSRQLATMIEAGVSVVRRSRRSRSRPTTSTSREVIAEVRSDVEAGMILSKAFARHPKVFNRLFVAMVEAGESSGTLDSVLDRVAIQIEKETQIKRRVKSAMVYPIVVMSFATLVLIFMLMFIVPVFVKVFDDLDGELPKPTQIVSACRTRCGTTGSSSSRRSALRSAASAGWKQTRARPSGTGTRSSSGSRCAIGDVVQQGRARALLADALEPRLRRRRHHQGARDHGRDLGQLGDRACRSTRPRARRRRACRSASRLQADPAFPPMVSQMVKIGEETGELDKMLGKVADFYEDEVDTSIQSLTSIIEPVMMIGVGVMVGHDRDLDVPADVQDALARQVALATDRGAAIGEAGRRKGLGYDSRPLGGVAQLVRAPDS